MKKVFIDGSAGTTGLRILERLEKRADLELIRLAEALRKDPSARADAINASDAAFLCLPDDAAREAAGMVANDKTVVIDTSTAHRVCEGWEYGFPELHGRRERIAASRRIANPGCHASGFVALVEPLVRAGIIARDAALTAFSLTGFSGGGKKMIADYGEHEGDVEYLGARQYALGQAHKHLPEMVKVCSLERAPVFAPVIAPHYSGMQTTVMLPGEIVEGGIRAVENCLKEAYSGERVVRYAESSSLPAVISSSLLTGRDDMLVSVHGNDERILAIACFDNLGKGASGAAIQNMNIALGFPETEGLELGG
ncbi:MAG: N-acetyl-gamma-glutamyl-phosphate reductase [Kiritimatiellae bacterium]|nr:N-acetyl-gamma-glutamyl-phosphate reductase [Kiritimatiellia bacterium]